MLVEYFHFLVENLCKGNTIRYRFYKFVAFFHFLSLSLSLSLSLLYLTYAYTHTHNPSVALQLLLLLISFHGIRACCCSIQSIQLWCDTRRQSIEPAHQQRRSRHNEHSDGKRSSYWEARLNELRILGIQDALVPCRTKLLELHQRSSWNSTQPNTRRLSRLGADRKSCVVLPCIMRSWSYAWLYSWFENT